MSYPTNANVIHPDYTSPGFQAYLYFELKSWIGRHFLKHRSRIDPARLESPALLDIGVGSSFKEGWMHMDFYVIRFNFLKRKKKRRKPEFQTDLRYPLKCLDNAFDGIYTGHTLEHLYPDRAYQLISEMFRILKPGCWLRISVPDLRRVVDYYTGAVHLKEYTFKAEGIANLTQNWGHRSVWDEELLNYALEIHGFQRVKRVHYGIEGNDKRLIVEDSERKDESFVMEAQKPAK